MKHRLQLALLAMPILAAMHALASPPPSDDAAKAACSFSNPQLPGWCNVTVPVAQHSTPQQACGAVLRCINSSACADSEKYCFNPGVRKNWKLEEARAWTPPADCGYSNPSYSGWCRLSAPVLKGMTPEGACQAVLPCLNGGPCEGFTGYCDPQNRSGWRLEEARASQPQPTPRR
jgi:hypothetical protein